MKYGNNRTPSNDFPRLHQDARIEVFRLLVKAGPEGLAAGEIARSLKSAANTTSAQLLVLANANLVRARRDGRSIIYSADFEVMRDLLIYLTEGLLRRPRGSVRAARRDRPQLLPTQKGERAMKRLHVHIAVADLDRSIGFYSTLFGAEPSVRKADYAKWMLEDPRVNLCHLAAPWSGGRRRSSGCSG